MEEKKKPLPPQLANNEGQSSLLFEGIEQGCQGSSQLFDLLQAWLIFISTYLKLFISPQQRIKPDFRFLKSCGGWKRRKTDLIYQDQHIHYLQVVCNFPVKIKFWREIILAMTFVCICVTFFNRTGDHPGPRSNQPQKLTYFSVELTFAPLSL